MSQLYYMAHIRNAPTIAAFGILPYNQIHSNPQVAAQIQSIADPFVNHRRHLRVIDGRSLHDFVPLYWATHTLELPRFRGQVNVWVSRVDLREPFELHW
jgi:hypothetical protein